MARWYRHCSARHDAVLFSATYVRNVIEYGSPKPTCTKTMERARCLKSGIINAMNVAKNKKLQTNLPFAGLRTEVVQQHDDLGRESLHKMFPQTIS